MSAVLALFSLSIPAAAAESHKTAAPVAAPAAPADATDKICKFGFWSPPVAAGCTGKKLVEKGPSGAAKDAIKEVGSTAAAPFAKSAREWVANLMKQGMTWWLTTDSVQIKDSGVMDESAKDPDNPESSITLQGIMLGIGVMVAILLMIWQAIKTMIQRKGTPLVQAFQGLIINAIVISVGIGVIDALLVASDKLSEAILNIGMGADEAPEKMVAMLLPQIGNPVGMLFMALVVLMVGGIQVVLLFLRQAAVPIQALLLPIAGSGQIGGDGAQKWLPRLMTAIMAVICYKPAASVIFAVGFIEIDNSTTTLDWLRGVTTLVLAIFTLKGLLNIFAPIGGVIGGAAASSGGFAGALATAGAAVGARGGGAGGGGDGASSGAAAGGGASSATKQAEFLERNGPAAQGGSGGQDGRSAVQQASQDSQEQLPSQRGASGSDSSTEAAGGASGASGAGASTAGKAAGGGGAVNVAVVAAEAGKQAADKSGETMGENK